MRSGLCSTLCPSMVTCPAISTARQPGSAPAHPLPGNHARLRRSPSNRNLEAVGRAALKFDAAPSLARALPLAAAALKG